MTLRLRRFDRMSLSKPIRRPDGSMIVEGVVARVGVLEYLTPDGSMWREMVTADTLRNSAPGLIGAPVTMEHPPEDVTPDTWKEYAEGTVLDARFDEETGELQAVMSVNNVDLLKAIDDGKEELSPGYLADVDETPGDSPEGQYDAVQSGRLYNHVAFVDDARGGSTVRARIDSAKHVITNSTELGVRSMNPYLLALAARLGVKNPASDEAELSNQIHRRCDAMSEEAAKKDAELEEAKSDAEGMEKFDADEYARMKDAYSEMKDENMQLKKMMDEMTSKYEMDGMKPMMDEYGVEKKQEDRADDVYLRIAEKITGQRVDAKSANIAEIRGMVKGHYTAITRDRQDGINAGRSAWGSGLPVAPRQDSQGDFAQHQRQQRFDRADVFRAGPSAIHDRQVTDAFNGK